MKLCAVCLPIRENQVLLGYKKRGFGQGKIVEIGGKLEAGETPEEAARRELEEECGLSVTEIEALGEVVFQFAGRPEWDMRVWIFVGRMWQGEPVETGEIAPEWFPKAALPYPCMWQDAPRWLPQVLAGEPVSLHFSFGEDGETLEKVQDLSHI